MDYTREARQSQLAFGSSLMVHGEIAAPGTGLGTVTASGCSRPVPPQYSLTNSASFSFASQLRAVSPFIHVFPWTKHLGKFLLSGQILIYPEVLDFWKIFFPYTLDVKILHLILYIGDLRPTIVGSIINCSYSLKSFEGSRKDSGLHRTWEKDLSLHF